MLFSKQKLEVAFRFSSIYYDKVIIVDFNENKFEPIRVSDKEWNSMKKNATFTEWLTDFVTSDNYRPCNDKNKDQLIDLLDLDAFKMRYDVMICNYFKFIDGEYHIVQMELYPIALTGCAYLFVRDLTKMQRGILPPQDIFEE